MMFERRRRRESETSDEDEDTAGRTEAGGKHITVDTGRCLFGKADLFHTHTHIYRLTHTHTCAVHLRNIPVDQEVLAWLSGSLLIQHAIQWLIPSPLHTG